MAGFIGNTPAETYVSLETQNFTTSATASYTLSNAVTNENEIALFINNVRQQPGSSYAYTASGTTLTLSSATAGTDTMYCVYLGKSVGTINPPDGSVGTAKIEDSAVTNDKLAGSITDAKISGLSASKLTGTIADARFPATLPAVSGANLTNLPSDVTKATSDPLISTNPSGGVGTLYLNKNSGELWCCTDATAGSNVWTNIASGSGDIEPWAFQGESYGYASGGGANVIDKWTFSSDANATDVGDLSVNRYGTCATSGQTHGFNAGNDSNSTTIDKFSFTSDGNATDVGDLTLGRDDATGQSSTTHGYCSGGSYSGGYSNTVDKWSHSSDGNATDVGDLTTTTQIPGGQSSSNHGYTSGGYTGSYSNVIDKFTFASDANATDVGDLTVGRSYNSGQSSSSHGYNSTGYTGSNINPIDKFAFASDGNATDVGDVTAARRHSGGQSSTTHGYAAGGYESSNSNVIDKNSHSSDGNSTDVGNLTVARRGCGGQQY